MTWFCFWLLYVSGFWIYKLTNNHKYRNFFLKSIIRARCLTIVDIWFLVCYLFIWINRINIELDCCTVHEFPYNFWCNDDSEYSCPTGVFLFEFFSKQGQWQTMTDRDRKWQVVEANLTVDTICGLSDRPLICLSTFFHVSDSVALGSIHGNALPFDQWYCFRALNCRDSLEPWNLAVRAPEAWHPWIML